MPNLIFYNGTILTMNPAQPQASVLAVRGGRILAVGGEEVLDLAHKNTERIDLSGRCLLPGFHDSHVHLSQHGLELDRLHLHDTPTLEAALKQIEERAQSLDQGAWLLGSGFSMSRWGVSHLDKTDLDRASPKNPVFLQSQDHHSAWTNSLALARAGVHADMPDPKSGTVVRGEDGEPSGLLLERAAHLVSDVIPEPSEADLSQAVRRGGEDLARLGITTVHHMAYEPTSYWRQMALGASRESFPVRVWACTPQEDAEHAAALGLATGQGGERFMIGGAKFFADGALGSMTAWMLEPYANTENYGVPVHDADVLAERLPLVLNAGLTPVVHAIGDAANRAVLGAFEATKSQWQAKGLRPRLEHAQHLHPDDLAKAGTLGIVVSMQPYHLVFDAPQIRERLPERVAGAYAMKSLQKAGAHLALGSDTPVADPNVRLGLRAACTRLGTDERELNASECLTPAEALAGYTSGAAYALGREGRSGSLKEGFDADMVVLSANPLDTLDFNIEGTLLAGGWTKPLE